MKTAFGTALWPFAFLIFALSACTLETAEEAPESACACNSQTHLTAGVLFTQHSGEYKALCYQAYASAKMQLPEAVAGVEKPAVVLDLDETVLDNSPYTAWQILNDRPYTPETWDDWVNLAEAEEVPGASDFLRFADSLGVRLMYISNRDTSQLAPTIANMESLGLPQLTPDHFMLKSNTSDKTARREAVRESGYEIVMLVGDNLGDFTGGYDKPATNDERNRLADRHSDRFGSKYIVLPNTLYGTWEGALYNYDRDISDEERCRLRNAALNAPEM